MRESRQDGLWRYEPAEAVCLRVGCGFRLSGVLAEIRPAVDDHTRTAEHAVRIIREAEDDGD